VEVLEYVGLEATRHHPQYQRVVQALARGEFRAAQVKKLVGVGHGRFYRAKLDDADRLLFTLVRYRDQTHILLLEVIAQHAYEKSRFLRGAHVDESKITDADAGTATQDAQPLRYLHPHRRHVHLLDKVISFDDAQDAIYRLPAPLIIVGAAGSGKTALTLEKMKHVEGEVLYVTQSPYLAHNARDLYYSHGFAKEGQEATFLSYREFLESLRVPPGREAVWRDYSAWFARMGQQFKGFDAHPSFEEIRGVISADAKGVLSRDAYRELGVRQSIFPREARDKLYDLFEKYSAWLQQAGLYDLNLVAQQLMSVAAPRYDFVVVDELQDLTAVQLALVLKTLRKPQHFMLCGDSNQIVHPNFFSWQAVKSLFWADAQSAEAQELRVLRSNFRNSEATTRVANSLLKIKQRRFGSIDRESNFLVDAASGEPGQVALIEDRDAVKKDLNARTKGSTQFAVLVMREEDKADARKFFTTPLVFSVHEAKGLEYENIILYRFISGHRSEFSEIAQGVRREDLVGDELEYRRAKDKTDRSLDTFKFYVNALYVALTRAVRNVYWIESDTTHPLLMLLSLQPGADQVQVQAAASSLNDWQREARKLELQGKHEQAEAIRDTVLRQAPVPWPVLDEVRLRELLGKVFQNPAPGAKHKQQLHEYAVSYDEPRLAEYLAEEAHYGDLTQFMAQRERFGSKHLAPFQARNFKEVLSNCDRYGIDYRTPMNLTPLMAAATAGNVPLVEALLERGADTAASDHLGRNALHWALRRAFTAPDYAQGSFGAIYELVAPSAVDVMVGERLVRIDRHLSEYLLLQTFWALFCDRWTHSTYRSRGGFATGVVLEAWQHLPANVLNPDRNKRSHLSNLLSRNEVDRDYAYNRHLFKRVATGWYQLNPQLALRIRRAAQEQWVPITRALNLALIKECADELLWDRIDEMLAVSGDSAPAPIAAQRRLAREAAEAEEFARQQVAAARAQVAQRHQRAAQSAAPPPRDADAPSREPVDILDLPAAPWGTPLARMQAIERLRRQNEERKRREAAQEPGEKS
jgi:hypothetical protein